MMRSALQNPVEDIQDRLRDEVLAGVLEVPRRLALDSSVVDSPDEHIQEGDVVVAAP